jgi:hypothetical protein
MNVSHLRIAEKKFLNADRDEPEVKQEELMPDLLHPNAAIGHKMILAKCIFDFIEHVR